MMRARTMLMCLLMLVVLTLAVPLLAAASDGCSDGFQLHPVDHHPGEPDGEHFHVGTDIDRNGDGYICGKHVSGDETVHVHTDNNLP